MLSLQRAAECRCVYVTENNSEYFMIQGEVCSLSDNQIVSAVEIPAAAANRAGNSTGVVCFVFSFKFLYRLSCLLYEFGDVFLLYCQNISYVYRLHFIFFKLCLGTRYFYQFMSNFCASVCCLYRLCSA